MKAEEFAEIGRLQKPHGIKGEISATIHEDIDTDNLSYIVTVIDGLYVPFFINSLRSRGSESVLLSFDGINDEQAAAELSMRPMLIRKSDLAAIGLDGDDSDDGMAASDLVGFTVMDENESGHTSQIGIIEGIRELTAENWLFEVGTPDCRTILVPIADELITDIDPDTRTITMSLPQGLTSL